MVTEAGWQEKRSAVWCPAAAGISTLFWSLLKQEPKTARQHAADINTLQK